MDEQSSSDHLNSSLTDLMTSLMVIFILLLLSSSIARLEETSSSLTPC